MGFICKHCCNSVGVNKPTHYRSCESYHRFVANVKLLLTKEYLEHEYITNGKSAAFIAKDIGLEKDRVVKHLLKEYNIPMRLTSKERAKSSHRQALTMNKSIARYGVKHHLMSIEVITKRNTTVHERYNCDNVFQTDVVKEKSHASIKRKYGVDFISQSSDIRARIKLTNLTRYGFDNPWKNPDIQRKCKESKIKLDRKFGYVSKASQQFIWKVYNSLPEIVKPLCYFHDLNREFGSWNGEQYFVYDFTIPSINYCLEYNGTFYHADPNVYAPDWVNKKLNMSASEIWKKDAKKNAHMINNGYVMDIVWQRDDDYSEVDRVISNILRIYYSNSQR